jgi:serine/threonine protein kinase
MTVPKANRPAPADPTVPTPAGPPRDLPPELANHPRYRILRELGRGGMGVVYQARQTMMDRQVVIKVINKSLLDRPQALERFAREVRAAAKLAHPNIVTAYDAEQAGDLHMLVMEFVPGRSLAEVLHRQGPLPVALACDYARQAALGLQHAFEQGMVHRDIKPANLMLTPQGQVKILDFGLARMASESGPGSGLTASGAYMGTPDYSAPEQATDARKADIHADLYSLGCTLYCLLAGRPPFREETPVLTILAHLEKEPPPLPELRPEVPAGLWAVVARLLAKDPAGRYQAPAEVARALAPFCEVAANAPPARVPPRPTPPERGTLSPQDTLRPPALRKGVADQVRSRKAVPAVPPVAELVTEPEQPRPQRAGAAGRRWLLAGTAAVLVVSLGLGAVLLGGFILWLGQRAASRPSAEGAHQFALAQPGEEPAMPLQPVGAFTAISATEAGKVVVRQTGKEALSIRGDKDRASTAQVENGTLVLVGARGVEFVVEAKDLRGLILKGTAGMEVKQVDTRQLTVTMEGTGNLSVSGRADVLQLTLIGTGNFVGDSLVTSSTAVEHRGPGTAAVNARDLLAVSIFGNGLVEYVGSPHQVHQNIHGGGMVRKK